MTTIVKRIIQTPKKHLLIFLMIFLIGREFLPFTLQYYRSSFTTQSNSSLSTNTQTTPILMANSSVINLDTDPSVQVYVEGIDEEKISFDAKYLTVSSSFQVTLGIGRFIPFYKNFSYSTQAYVSCSQTIHKRGKAHQINMSGSIYIRGTMQIVGICAVKQARFLAEKNLKGQVRKKIMIQLQETLSNLQ